MSLKGFDVKNKRLLLSEGKSQFYLSNQVGYFEARAQVSRINKALSRCSFCFHCLRMRQSLLTNSDGYKVSSHDCKNQTPLRRHLSQRIPSQQLVT